MLCVWKQSSKIINKQIKIQRNSKINRKIVYNGIYGGISSNFQFNTDNEYYTSQNIVYLEEKD